MCFEVNALNKRFFECAILYMLFKTWVMEVRFYCMYRILHFKQHNTGFLCIEKQKINLIFSRKAAFLRVRMNMHTLLAGKCVNLKKKKK